MVKKANKQVMWKERAFLFIYKYINKGIIYKALWYTIGL